jgi:hypothetical protein
MTPVRIVFICLVFFLLQFLVSVLAIKVTRVNKPTGVLTFYGGDIYYVDTDELRVTSESGNHDVHFKSFDQMSKWLGDISAEESNKMLTLELGIAMGQCSASVLPNVSGVELKAYNFYTRDTVSMLLDSTDNGITWVQRDRD